MAFETVNKVMENLKAQFPEDIISFREPVPKKAYAAVNPKAIRKLSEYIFRSMGARFLSIIGVDRRPTHSDFQATYVFSFDKEKIFLLLQVSLNKDNPEIDSITPVIPGANWAERELYDMLGIKINGHVDPRRLILPDDWPENLHPLRRDFVYSCRPDPVKGAAPKPIEPPENASVVPLGPFYPTLEEPAVFRLFVEGETVVGCDYRGFYNHRGIEKMGDSVLTYNQTPFLAERICGICGFIHSTCYVEATEEAAQIEVPLRAKYIRSILLELERIHSHPLWLGIGGHVLGFDTVLMQTWRMREPVMWLMETITGSRKSFGMNLVGGVRMDITPDKKPKILEVVNHLEKQWLELIDAIQGDTPLMMRLKNIGILKHADAVDHCVTGPTARGSAVHIDARVDHPYSAYDYLVPEKKVHDTCDNLARTLVRLEETLDSIRLVRKGIKEIPEGPIMADIPEKLPAGKEGVRVVEAPRGEAIHYVLTGEDNRPYRWKVRAPSYVNMEAVPWMIKGMELADVPIAIASFDPCFSCTERLEVVDQKSGKIKIYTEKELIELCQKKYK